MKCSVLPFILACCVVESWGFAPHQVSFEMMTKQESSTLSLHATTQKPHVSLEVSKVIFTGVLSAALLFTPNAALADGQTEKFKFPPIDFTDTNRCTLSSSKMGQANASRDKLYDLRQCDLSGKDASGFDLSGVIMDKTNVSNVKFVESQFSKAFLRNSNFDGADFTNGVVDRATFAGSSLRGAIFKNAVLTGTTFGDADLENADFTDSYIGSFDLKNLCKNPTLKGENPVTGADTLLSAGCVN
jgi:uncharacterized protein YjbI with pentapeptide repeats